MHGEFASANRCSRTFVICINFSHLAIGNGLQKLHCFLKIICRNKLHATIITIEYTYASLFLCRSWQFSHSRPTNAALCMNGTLNMTREKKTHKTSLNKYNSAKCCQQFMIIRSCACDATKNFILRTKQKIESCKIRDFFFFLNSFFIFFFDF